MKKQQQGSYLTPNEKFKTEFGEDTANTPTTQTTGAARTGGAGSAGSSSYKTPNEKFDEEFKPTDQA
ncbi:hypothetical protein [Paenibacillus cookii]|uniref:Uncharacterized protein n=1 Tax=Paenibacillus cookii TaxID=157839 RepID=A0ABQ4LYB7_9BACL|nr:hypothetical protein [Paenibacillus cookii]KHF31610.1 hypothetical protein CM49_06186 [Paenibacillus sp. P1XP2]GIO68138.1 hypothetical protein J21TS3_29590 [Paenibacillus cookii]